MRVSLVATVLNEERSLPGLMDSVLAQTRLPDEVVIVDGGSRDGTLGVLAQYASKMPLRVLISPGSSISHGRNVAIAAARGEIIACTDAGVRLSPRWLADLVAPFTEQRAKDPPLPDSAVPPTLPPMVVCGFFLPDAHTVFETAMGATVLPRPEEIDPARFLPSSRSVAFTRSAWELGGGYPEWLDYCEDLVFDLALRQAGVPFHWAPGALVYFRPRSSLRSFYRQYYRYARGDGKADLWRRRHAIRYGTYLGGALAALGGVWWPWLWGVLLLAGLAYLWQPYRRLWHLRAGLRRRERAQAALWVPIIRATGDVAKMVGYPVGVWWRLRRRRSSTPRSSRATDQDYVR